MEASKTSRITYLKKRILLKHKDKFLQYEKKLPIIKLNIDGLTYLIICHCFRKTRTFLLKHTNIIVKIPKVLVRRATIRSTLRRKVKALLYSACVDQKHVIICKLVKVS